MHEPRLTSLLQRLVPAMVLGATLFGTSLAPRAAPADVFKFIDPRGQTHFSDRQLHRGYRVIVRSRKGWEFRKSAPRLSPRPSSEFQQLIDEMAKRHHLDPSLVHAVVRAESAYDPEAVSRAGAVGLMQLMPATAKRFGVRNRRDPADNLRGGMLYLRYLLLLFDDLSLAIAAYNAGEGAVSKYGNKIPPYKETQTYVRRVLSFYQANLGQK
jgi:soluble lytic murein transglycosylase-like protein